MDTFADSSRRASLRSTGLVHRALIAGVACGLLTSTLARAQGSDEQVNVRTYSEVQFWSTGPAAGPACAAERAATVGEAPFTAVSRCALAERPLPIAAGQVSEVRDRGAFAAGLADAAGAARGASVVGGRHCAVRALACGRSVAGDLAASECTGDDGAAVALFELPVTSGQRLRLELRTEARDGLLAVADSRLRLRDSVWSAGAPIALEQEVDQTGRWGVALAASGIDTTYQLDVVCDGQAVGAAPPDGTYTGTHSDVGDMNLVVLNNTIQSYTFENFSCPFGSIVETGSSFTPGCAIADNGSFSCGSVGCVPFGTQHRIQGVFAGNTVTGNLTFNQQPDVLTSCCQRNLLFTANLGGGQTAPAAPSSLVATATSSTTINLTWQDNSDDEDDFRIEQREGASGDFEEVGTASANAEAVTISGLDPGTLYGYRLRARNAAGFSDFSNVVSATTPTGGAGCVPSATRLCLQQDRFAVEVTFRTTAGGQLGTAQGYEETADSGLFFFFEQTNLEKLIKVLNGCPLNNRYWVFFAATTDIEFTVKVTDTQSGQIKTYTNPLGQAANAVTDTDAFATCP